MTKLKKEEELERMLLSINHEFKSTSILPTKQVKDYLRYALWVGLVNTANANRRHFGLTTTWAPHLLGNSVALFLPEIYDATVDALPSRNGLNCEQNSARAVFHTLFKQLVSHNPNYLNYVAPAALAYVVSHPRFNIYRGDWGELKLLGFGLDSIPHSTTAYALSTLIYDAVKVLQGNTAVDTPLYPYVAWLATHKDLATGASLVFLTLCYETGEYCIHKSELKARDNDVSQINMMWSITDTIFDALSNLAGWAFAAWRHR